MKITKYYVPIVLDIKTAGFFLLKFSEGNYESVDSRARASHSRLPDFPSKDHATTQKILKVLQSTNGAHCAV